MEFEFITANITTKTPLLLLFKDRNEWKCFFTLHNSFKCAESPFIVVSKSEPEAHCWTTKSIRSQIKQPCIQLAILIFSVLSLCFQFVMQLKFLWKSKLSPGVRSFSLETGWKCRCCCCCLQRLSSLFLCVFTLMRRSFSEPRHVFSYRALSAQPMKLPIAPWRIGARHTTAKAYR